MMGKGRGEKKQQQQQQQQQQHNTVYRKNVTNFATISLTKFEKHYRGPVLFSEVWHHYDGLWEMRSKTVHWEAKWLPSLKLCLYFGKLFY